MLFFVLTDVEQADRFFEGPWPEARAVSDPDAAWYQAFGIGRASVLSFLDPRVFAAGLRAVVKGNAVGLPQGDPFVLPGMLLVRGDEVLWRHRYRHVGDLPDLRALAELAAGRA